MAREEVRSTVRDDTQVSRLPSLYNQSKGAEVVRKNRVKDFQPSAPRLVSRLLSLYQLPSVI